MNGEAIIAVSAAVVALVSLIKWAGVNERLGPLAVLVFSAIGCAIWGYSTADFARETIFAYFAGWIAVATSAAGVYGFTRSSGEQLTQFRNKVPIVLLCAALAGGMLLSQACAPKMLVLTPEGARAYTATEIGKRVGALGDAAIAAHDSGALTDAVAVPIVLFTYNALKVLEATPAGWAQTVAEAWIRLKAIMPGPVSPILAATWGAVDVILAAFQPVPGEVPKVDPITLERQELWLAAQGAV